MMLVDRYQNCSLPDGQVLGWGTGAGNRCAEYGLHPDQLGDDLTGATWADAIQAAIVPEPTSFALLATCITGGAWRRAKA